MYAFALDGVRVAHLGDLGQSILRGEQAAALGEVDLLFVPVGDGPTIGARSRTRSSATLGARWVVPMHYRTRAHELPRDRGRVPRALRRVTLAAGRELRALRGRRRRGGARRSLGTDVRGLAGDHDAVAAARLRFVERGVGAAEQLERALAAVPQRDADRARDARRAAPRAAARRPRRRRRARTAGTPLRTPRRRSGRGSRRRAGVSAQASAAACSRRSPPGWPWRSL